MSDPFEHAPIGRGPLLAAGALMLAALVGTAAMRWTGQPATVRADAEVVASRSLRFEDRPDGSIAVISHSTGQVVQRIEGESGFVRGTLRGLARERRRAGMGPEQPFVLSAHADGRITLTDPVTQRRIDLASFGALNPRPFVEMLREPDPVALALPGGDIHHSRSRP